MSAISQTQPNAVPCRVCGSRDTALLCRTVNEHSRTRLLDNFRCRACGSVFIGNELTGEELGEAYATLDEKAYYAETAAASAAKFRDAAREVADLGSPTAEILDIGGGDGAFVRALKAAGFANLAIHEIPGGDLADLSGVAGRIFRDVDYATIPSENFDVVTMMDVMEHVPDPATTIAAAWRVLRPGGLLYLHTPVVTKLDRLMHGVLGAPLVGGVARGWQRARTSIFHLQNYTPRALDMLARRAGFEVLTNRTINELSWPLERYVRVYLVDKLGMPRSLSPAVAAASALLVRSALHANKGVLVARRLAERPA